MNVFDASLTSSPRIVLRPAWFDMSTALLAIVVAISSRTRLSSSADSSLTRSAPAFFNILYMADRPNSDDFIQNGIDFLI